MNTFIRCSEWLKMHFEFSCNTNCRLQQKPLSHIPFHIQINLNTNCVFENGYKNDCYSRFVRACVEPQQGHVCNEIIVCLAAKCT